MKSYLVIIVAALLFVACKATKDTVTTETRTPEVITETVVALPANPTIDPVEEIQENVEVTEPVEIVEETEVVDNSNQNMPEVMVEVVTFDHSNFNSILKQNVSAAGNVNYDAIKSNWSSLRNYINALSENMPTDNWSKNEKLAYWMNAYNAMTIDLILRHQPLGSIKDIKNPWEQRFWKLGDKYYNLDEIEHQILRKMGDPRIHFGINCASFSCPPLLNEAFAGDTVDAQLDKVARKFINDPKRNTITADRLEISEIFNWFAKDFKKNGSLIDYLNQYSETKISGNAKIRFKDYDWALNK